jgi:cyclopropane fatty-acyl-phospholipid synthase-like methyltransferase
MKYWIAAAAALLFGPATFAQTTPQTPMEQHHMDHSGHMNAGGGFNHSFSDAERWAKEFDDPARDGWQKPSEVVDALDLKPDSIVADIGAGTGYFAVRIARRVPQGQVFAADVEPGMVRYLGERAARERLAGIVPVQAGADAANLPQPVDLILVVDTYHHIGNRTDYFAKLQSSLRPGGRLVIIDFKMDAPDGPPPAHRIPADKVEQELGAVGYSLVQTHAFLPRQYFLVFEKR